MRFDSRLDAYRELGLTPNASQEEIRQAYRQLARRYHPDHAPEGKQQEYEEKMKRVNAAYAILSDPQQRTQYDQSRRNGATPSAPTHTKPSAASFSPRDPYFQMRQGYQQRLYRVQINTHQLPVWAQMLSGLFAGLGLVAGFLIGLPFGIVGCIPGALVGLIGGMLVGLFAVYLLMLMLPAALLASIGYWVMGTPGGWLGALLGILLGYRWLLRLRNRK